MWPWPRIVVNHRWLRKSDSYTTNGPNDGAAQPEQLNRSVPKEVHDLKNLPPGTAADLDVQKLMQMGGGRKAWVKVTPRITTQDNDFSGGTQAGSKAVKAGALFKGPGERIRMGRVEQVIELPTDLAENRGPEELTKWVEAHGLIPPEFRKSNLQATQAANRETLTRAVNYGTLAVVCAAIGIAIGMAGVGLWSLYLR